MSFLGQGMALLLAYSALTNHTSWWLVPLPLITELVLVALFEWLASRPLPPREEKPFVMSEGAFETYAEGMQAEREAKAAAEQNKAVN